jgi:predicted DNA-binding protein (UPF0251 family)
VPRHKKRRCCRGHHGEKIFKPVATPLHRLKRLELQEDQLEAIRLCDLEGLSQEEAGERMGISRGTVQRLLASGRKALVEFVTEGTSLEVVPTKNHPY